MRITGGEFKGRRLFAPRGLDIRPTSDRVKEAVFNILGPLQDKPNVLDLFAGTGALGLEALSRGAEQAVFVDRSLKALAAIRKNIEMLDLQGRTRVVRANLPGLPKGLKELGPFDLIFLDPPYGRGLAGRSLALAAGMNLTAPGATALVEHAPSEELESAGPGWRLVRSRA
ncbi:MAG: 16S rRNA (guanine(966)-N(2))-methyltransferase RsmD [Pseudomonadota bacterium]